VRRTARAGIVAALLVGVAVLGPPGSHPGRVPTARAQGCGEWVRARPNDSWSRLAARHGLGLSTVLELNGATVGTFIRVGDRLCVGARPTVVVPETRPRRAAVIAIIREVWPDEHEETAIFVARRESNLDPTVVGGRDDCCLGLFQIYWSVHRSWLAAAGVGDPSQLLDARTNAQAAYRLFRRNGDSWRPWWTSSWRP
jgi:hypothetical protein